MPAFPFQSHSQAVADLANGGVAGLARPAVSVDMVDSHLLVEAGDTEALLAVAFFAARLGWSLSEAIAAVREVDDH